MKTYKLNKSLILKEEEITALKALPNNSPNIKLTKKQIDLVRDIYYKYVENKITYGWGTQLYEIEMKEKWPSGPRMKSHEAKRIILNNLLDLNTRCKVMTVQQAAEKFHSALSCRESWQILVDKAFR